ncbi:MAG: 3-phosphoshikimate 1-carboxyvinyltransferase [Anaerolineales bacterium]|nr:3-phosphoshikimate 1-carboxyvinyltransferase [Anaerolineales bacterium]MCB9126640.1 3-phosphoshikimate 1-carboxyvinyltransferase [Ardenticatenales bacterium]MCB9172734.1 3-phosphoshikimate 1-carboxyvinyltransferase [Ardenticatenales bacterium]
MPKHKTLTVQPATQPLRGSALVAGDKSLSHRVALLGALAEGTTHAEGWLAAEDTLATLRVLRALGVPIAQDGDRITVTGVGLQGFSAPADALDCGGSGTTMRLLSGILAGQPFATTLTGNDALRRRPMGRIATPLRRMGATIESHVVGQRELPPLTITGGPLRAIDYTLPIASAQVKSAVLLAALFADGPSTVIEAGPARDHTERMLSAMGAGLTVDGPTIRVVPPTAPLRPLGDGAGGPFRIPADPSSAAFLVVAATLVRGSHIRLPDVGLNPTRTGLFELLQQMGAKISPENALTQGGEPRGDLQVAGSELNGLPIGGEIVVRAIDEFPILAVAATQASGRTEVRDAAELRVKESDRIAAVVAGLTALGAKIEERADGFALNGPQRLRGGTVDSAMDHRLAMALAVAALVAEGPVRIERAEVIDDSFPTFVPLMRALGAEMAWECEGR